MKEQVKRKMEKRAKKIKLNPGDHQSVSWSYVTGERQHKQRWKNGNRSMVTWEKIIANR
jgi:hypothetical protein